MLPIFTICFIIFLIILNYKIHKSNKTLKDYEDNFWERERQANLTRRKDISNLDYIIIPEDLFPMNLNSNIENEIASLRGKKMLNLTGLSNTELKFEYGIQNLEELSACDDYFTEFARLLPLYANELTEEGQTEAAKKILEFGIQYKVDSKTAFTQLAQLYVETGETNKIQHLIQIASELNSLMKNPIISSLQEIQNTNL